MEEQDYWIPMHIKARPPKRGQSVLVSTGGTVFEAVFHQDGRGFVVWDGRGEEYITAGPIDAWRPLPAPYKKPSE